MGGKVTFPSLPKRLRALKDADLACTIPFSCKLNEVSHGAHICFLLSVCPCPSELRDVSRFGQRTWEMLPGDV